MNVERLKQTEEFGRIWENRYQPPVITTSWVNNDWARGRTNYLSFLISVGGKTLVDSIKEIQTKLASYKCVDIFPEKYLHITVKELGSFLASEKQSPDELTDEELPRLIEEAREKLRSFKRLELRLENLNNFKSTVCVEVHDGGIIRNMNGALMQIHGMCRLRNDYPRFLPHVSIAQYRSMEDYEHLIRHLEKNRETQVGSLKVDTVKLVVVKLPTTGRYPRFRLLKEFRLE